MHQILWTILAVGAGTYFIRAGSLSLGSRVTWPPAVRQWLTFITPAVLGALLGPSLFLQSNDALIPFAHNAMLWATLPTALVAWWTRHLLGTVALGIVFYTLCSLWLGVS